MAEEEAVTILTPPVDLKRKLDDLEPNVLEQHTSSNNGSNGVIVDDNNNPESDSSKRLKLHDEAEEESLDNGETQENGSSMKVKAEEEEENKEPSSEHKDEKNQESVPIDDEVQDPISADEPENKTCGVEDDHIGEKIVEECKDVNGDESKELNDGSYEKEVGKEDKEVDGDDTQKEVDGSQSTTRMMEVPSSKVGILIGKGGETIRNLQFNSGAKIQILRDSEADPNSAVRPVEIIGNVSCIENAKKLINAVILEAEAGGSPALVARGHLVTHAIGIPEQIEIKVPNDKVGVIIGRGGETIKNMQTRSGARIQLIPQQAEGDGSKERTVRISGEKRQIDIATDMIKEAMYQNARPSTYSGGYNQPAYPPRGPGGPPQWGSRGPHAPHSMPYDYHHRGPYSYSSQGSHYNSHGYGGYPPQHMPPRGGYGAGWDQRPPHSGPYDYYGRQGGQTSGPVPHSGHAPSPALGGPPPSQVSYGYGQSHGPEYGQAAPYSQTGHQQTYGQMYEQPKYDNNPQMQPPYGGSYPPAGGAQPGYSQTQQPGVRPYGMQQGPVQQGYGPPRPAAAASSGEVPYQGAAPAAALPSSYGSTNIAPQQQPYGYTSSSAPVQQQTYLSYNSVPPSDVQPAQPAYGTVQTQNSGNYGYNTVSQDPNYGYGAAPGSQTAYSQAAPTQTGYEQQPAPQPAGYAAAPGSAQVKTQSPQSAYAQYDASQVYATQR